MYRRGSIVQFISVGPDCSDTVGLGVSTHPTQRAKGAIEPHSVEAGRKEELDRGRCIDSVSKIKFFSVTLTFCQHARFLKLSCYMRHDDVDMRQIYIADYCSVIRTANVNGYRDEIEIKYNQI